MPLLEATDLHERVRAAVEQHRDDVAELVNAEVDRLVQQLVADRIAASNGRPQHTVAMSPLGDTPSPADPQPSDRSTSVTAATKRCTRCQEAKPLSEFRRHRGTCRNCRREQDRERNAARRRQEGAVGPLETGAGSTSTGSVGDDTASATPSPT